MEICTSSSELTRALTQARKNGNEIGFVPTMGALHRGHLSLVEVAKSSGCASTTTTVMSIFVNPLQFNSAKDLERYPRTLEADTKLAESVGVDVLFAPNLKEIYSGTADGSGTGATVKAGSRSLGLEGAFRPGHFDGVVTVVSILFNIVRPDFAVFGEKDYQQLKVIEQLVEDLHFDLRIVPGKLIRDHDGLALSSRNVLLSAADRFNALYISKSLVHAQELVARGENSAKNIRQIVWDNLERPKGLNIEYVEIVDADTLVPLETIEKQAQLLVAASVSGIRLIDNIRLVRGH